MMKKENLKALLIVVLIVLSVMFIITIYDKNKAVVQGLAPLPAEIGCSCMSDGYTVGMNDCLSWDLPKYCIGKGDPPVCTIIDNCEECGCFSHSFNCSESGACVPYDWGGDDGTSGPDPNSCPQGSCTDADGDGISEDCGSGGVCINGCCMNSVCGDTICDYREQNEKCSECVVDCAGGIEELGGCFAPNTICEIDPFDSEVAQCVPYSAPTYSCSDGTSDETCSNVTHGGYCQYDTDEGDYLLTGSCGGLCPCPEDYICEEDGFCILDNTTQESPPTEEVDNYCEYVGGICQEECSGDYFPLDETEYPELVGDCRDKDSSYNCCYPYENDDINDCEYYGGSCLASCGDDSYHADVEYIDDECAYYGNTGDICCIPYDQVEETTEEVDVDGSWIDGLFGGNGEDGKDSDAKLSENISLNRGVIISMVLLVIGLGALVYLFLRTNKGKR